MCIIKVIFCGFSYSPICIIMCSRLNFRPWLLLVVTIIIKSFIHHYKFCLEMTLSIGINRTKIRPLFEFVEFIRIDVKGNFFFLIMWHSTDSSRAII